MCGGMVCGGMVCGGMVCGGMVCGGMVCGGMVCAQWFKTIGDDDIFEPLKNIYIIPSLYRYDVI